MAAILDLVFGSKWVKNEDFDKSKMAAICIKMCFSTFLYIWQPSWICEATNEASVNVGQLLYKRHPIVYLNRLQK